MRVLVTGANGLLGRDVGRELTARGCDVTQILSPWSFEAPLANSLKIDLAGPWVYEDLPSSIDAVIHLAQSNKFRDFPLEALDIFQVNVTSTFKLLDYARRAGAQSFVFASTGGLYEASNSVLTETSTLHQGTKLGPYYASKYSAEILVQSFSQQFQTTILRPFFIYGKGQKRSMLLPRIFDKVKNREPVLLSGTDGLVFNPVHVRDASAAVCSSVFQPPQKIVNIAGPKIYSLRCVAELFGRFLDTEPEFEFVDSDSESHSVNSLVVDTALMGQALHLPQIRLETSISDVAS